MADEITITVSGIRGTSAPVELYKGTDADSASAAFKSGLNEFERFDAIARTDSAGNDFRQETHKPRPVKSKEKA